jgi:hypothetical protein
MANRKQRKQNRKTKGLTNKERDTIARELAKHLNRYNKRSEDSLIHFCPKCSRSYCHAVGKDQYCESCYIIKNFKNACKKQNGGNGLCLNCQK